MESSKDNILKVWFLWHFVETPNFLVEVWWNYILFALNYFSIITLLKSLFSPWRRYRWNYPRGFDIYEFFSTLISNSFSRFLGALVRIVLIISGIMFQIFILVFGAFIILFWILMPFIILTGLLSIFFNVI
jgi:hypothetical protein